MRRTKSEIQAIKVAIVRFAFENRPVSVRQTFYHLVSRNFVEKRDAECGNTVDRLMVKMRENGELPWEWVRDNSRDIYKPRTFSSAEDALANLIVTYRRKVFDDLDEYVVIGIEKEALVGVLYEQVTALYDVPLVPLRGFSGVGYLHEDVAKMIALTGKPCRFFYLGDYDPSGNDIARDAELKLRRYVRELAPSIDLDFERVAVTQDQIVSLNLPTRPTKTTDTRSKGFVGESVEVDAIPPADLRAMVVECIRRVVSDEHLQDITDQEQRDKDLLQELRGRMP